MPKRVKWKWNSSEFESQLHRGAPTVKLINGVANTIADNAAAPSDRGAEYTVDGFQGHDRYQVHIGTKNWGAMWDERRDKLLTRAIFGSFK